MGKRTWKVLIEYRDGRIKAYSTDDPVRLLKEEDMSTVVEYRVREVGSD